MASPRREEFTKQVAGFRWITGRIIANFKTSRVLRTDYHPPLNTVTETIAPVTAVHFYGQRE